MCRELFTLLSFTSVEITENMVELCIFDDEVLAHARDHFDVDNCRCYDPNEVCN